MAAITYTFKELQERTSLLLKDKSNTRFLLDTVKKAINIENARIVQSDFFEFRETSSNISVTADVNTFTLPTDFDLTSPDKTMVYWESIKKNNQIDYLNGRRNPDSTLTGKPRYWYKFAGTGYLWRTPHENNTIIFQYFKTVDEMTADTDVSLIPGAYADVIAFGAAQNLMSSTDPDFIMVQSEYMNRYNQLIDHFLVKNHDNHQERVAPSQRSYW